MSNNKNEIFNLCLWIICHAPAEIQSVPSALRGYDIQISETYLTIFISEKVQQTQYTLTAM